MEVIIDLGEYGEVLVETSDEVAPSITDGATEKTGFGDTVRQAGIRIKVEAAKLLKLPLTGIARLMLTSLPEPSADSPYDLDQFCVEFNLGIKTEVGSNAGAVAKVMPEGAFKCTYTWKRKPKLPSSEPLSS